MGARLRPCIRLAVVLCAVALPTSSLSAGPVVLGPADDPVSETLSMSYSTAVRQVEVGTSSAAVELCYCWSSGPLALELTASSGVYHHLHVIEHWCVTGAPLNELRLTLMVGDGSGGWTCSGNDDDLWFSARVGLTDWPVVSPASAAITITGTPHDRVTITWDGDLAADTAVTLDYYVTVPASIRTFAIFHSPAIPEPASATLVGLGLLTLARRRRHPR